MKSYSKAMIWLTLLPLMAAHSASAFRLTSSNTRVTFVVQRLGIQWVTARFGDIEGNMLIDPTGMSRVDVTVGIASLDCNEPRWNERLRSPDWLDVRRFPQMTYHSNAIELDGDAAVARGDLTLHGVTRPIVLNVSLQECSAGGRCRFAARGHIRRSEYGLPHGFWTGGDQVEISIDGALPRPSVVVR